MTAPAHDLREWLAVTQGWAYDDFEWSDATGYPLRVEWRYRGLRLAVVTDPSSFNAAQMQYLIVRGAWKPKDGAALAWRSLSSTHSPNFPNTIARYIGDYGWWMWFGVAPFASVRERAEHVVDKEGP